jgi:hypothetical protein
MEQLKKLFSGENEAFMGNRRESWLRKQKKINGRGEWI